MTAPVQAFISVIAGAGMFVALISIGIQAVVAAIIVALTALTIGIIQ